MTDFSVLLGYLMYLLIMSIPVIIFLIIAFMIFVLIKFAIIPVYRKIKEQEAPIDYSTKGIDAVSDEELVYFGKNSEKKKEIEQLIEKDRKENQHKKSKGVGIFKYMDAASKAFTVFLALFIIDIPLSFVIPYIFLYLGALVDGAMYNPPPNMPGHAVPIFAGFGFVIGIFVALILAVALLVGLIISFSFFLASKIKKKNKNKS